MKKFNTTGVCIPSKHYMVDLSERVAEIGKMVDDGKYFTINRARQYGKTTTIDYFGLTTGYMLCFNFNKRKETGVKQVHVGDKLLYEATV